MTPAWAPPEGIEEIEREAKTRRKRLGIENLKPEYRTAFALIDILLDGSDFDPLHSLTALTYATVMLFDVIAESAPVRSKVGKKAITDIIAKNFFEAVEAAIESHEEYERGKKT